MLTRGRIQVFEDEAGAYKLCADCGARFEVEFNRLGQRTSRKLCDLCREARAHRIGADLPGIPADAKRCVDCLALVGLNFGSVTHLDTNGRCSSCAAWEEKRMRRNQYHEALALIAQLRARVANLEAQVKALKWADAPPEPASVEAPPGPPAAYLSPAVAHVALDKLAKEKGYAGVAIVEGRLRDKQMSELRHGVAQALRAREWPVMLIGGLLNRHHTTILSALERRGPEIDLYRASYDRLLNETQVEGQQERALAALINQRADTLNQRSHQYARRGVSIPAPRPPGHQSPSIFARRWGVTTGRVRYWVTTGRLQAVKGADGRLWIAESTERPGAVSAAS